MLTEFVMPVVEAIKRTNRLLVSGVGGRKYRCTTGLREEEWFVCHTRRPLWKKAPSLEHRGKSAGERAEARQKESKLERRKKFEQKDVGACL